MPAKEAMQFRTQSRIETPTKPQNGSPIAGRPPADYDDAIALSGVSVSYAARDGEVAACAGKV